MHGKANKGKSCLVFSLVYKRYLKWASCRKSLISTGKGGRLKPHKLLNLFGISGIKIRQLSIPLL